MCTDTRAHAENNLYFSSIISSYFTSNIQTNKSFIPSPVDLHVYLAGWLEMHAVGCIRLSRQNLLVIVLVFSISYNLLNTHSYDDDDDDDGLFIAPEYLRQHSHNKS